MSADIAKDGVIVRHWKNILVIVEAQFFLPPRFSVNFSWDHNEFFPHKKTSVSAPKNTAYIKLVFSWEQIFSNMLYFLTFCLLFHQEIANAQFVATEGDERHPLQALDVPFVPEDFRSSPKRIIFDKNDYVSLLPSEDLEKPLTEAIISLLQETQARANDSKVNISLNTYPFIYLVFYRLITKLRCNTLAWPSLEVVPVTRPTSQPQYKSKFANAIWPSVTMKNAT